MLRLATYYTPTHREMAERFVLSRAEGFGEVIAREYPQKCASASFKQSGWNECMLDKLDLLMRLPQDGTPTLYVDADVCLLPGLAAWCERQVAGMKFHEVAYSDDVAQWCAGVMLFRSTAKTHAWWRLVADMSALLDQPDQDVIHALRINAKRLPVPMTVLPANRMANWATLGNTSVWQGEVFAVPETAVAWHANWCVGVEAKLAMLEHVAETTGGAVVPG
jgi:hypothetical protein